ncbi:MAG: hypothetical protein RI885_1169 [Actinomycetota bacterium]
MTSSQAAGWRRVVAGNRVVWMIAATAAGSLVLGTVLGAVIAANRTSGPDGAEPVAGLITAPVERRVITNEIVTRGDAVFADAVEVRLDASTLDGPALVSGRIPAVGSALEAGSVALEVAGRPLIVLPGELPAYRTMKVGTSGSDVAQLKAALTALGIDPGDESSPVFDAATAGAVTALYARVGYDRPESDAGTTEAIAGAESVVRTADLAVLGARRALTVAQAGASAGDRAEQDAQVRAAERALATAQAAGVASEIATAQDAVDVAGVRRQDALAVQDTSVEQAGLAVATADAAAARRALTEARSDALAFLPAREVAFLSSLPRRVDATTAVRGRPLEGPAFTASGAMLSVVADVSAADASRVAVGGAVAITLADGTEVAGTIASIAAAGGGRNDTSEEGGSEQPDAATAPVGGSSTTVAITPTVTTEQLLALQGQNVRVAIPVESTDGEVLAVPLAALSAGADGASRVEIPTGVGRATDLIPVETGLAAGGFVEISPREGRIEPGDPVVVGR